MNKPLLFSTALFLATLLPGRPAHGCLNNYEISPQGRRAIEQSQSLLDELTKHPNAEPWPERRARLQKDLDAGGDYKVKNDLAVALLHLGETAPAIALLEQVETEKPGLYNTAANLGTAYELAGDNPKALALLRKSIELNPAAHERTEWLHLKILEAKIAITADPAWIKTNTILGRTFVEKEPLPPLRGNRGEPLTNDQVKLALKYQLHERLQFVKAPDFIVGNLLVDLGTVVAKGPLGPAAAGGVFDLALKFLKSGQSFENESDLVERARSGQVLAFTRVDRQPREVGWLEKYRAWVWPVIAFPSALGGVSLYRRFRRKTPASA
jgi:tetratricopeptide (TPR) repeat protein